MNPSLAGAIRSLELLLLPLQLNTNRFSPLLMSPLREAKSFRKDFVAHQEQTEALKMLR